MFDSLFDLAQYGRIHATIRPAEDRPGMPATPAVLYIETSHPRDVNVGGGTVQWSGWFAPTDRDHIEGLNAILRVVADYISDAGRTAAALRSAILDRDIARRTQKDAATRLDRVLHGRTPAFGEILVRVDQRTGAAWLLDPVRKDAGFGLYFPSLADLWREHPELRPIRWGADADGPVLIVSAFAMCPAAKPEAP